MGLFILFVLIPLYIFFVHKYLSIYAVVTAVIIMLARVPDIIYEIKVGEKLSYKNMPKNKFSIFLTLLQWASIFIMFYGANCF